MDIRFFIQGGTGLVHNAEAVTDWKAADITLSGTRIDRVGRFQNHHDGSHVFDAAGLLVLPGIIDIHSDAFERQIQPRPGAVFPLEVALADTDRQLVANGITTACHGLTYSWEGGLRGREPAFALLNQIDQQRKASYADHRVHLRFENHHVDGLQDVLNWMAEGKIDFLTFNNHLPSIIKKLMHSEKIEAYATRAGCAPKEFMKRLQRAQSHAAIVPSVITALAGACLEHGIPMASHDDKTCADREHFHGMGVGISEFPNTQDALFAAMALDNLVVMGAPNVLLGGSQNGGLSAIDAIRSCMCDILASDYYYPSLLHAPFKLAHQGVCTLADAWRLVSENPAKALGFVDRGRIANGYRADLLLVETSAAGSVRLVATIAAGKLVYCAEPQRLLTRQYYQLAA